MSWDDQIKPGVQVLTPNPFSSGSARWNVVAAYGAKLLKEGSTPAQAQAYPGQSYMAPAFTQEGAQLPG